MNIIQVEKNIGGRTLSIEVGRMAKQADGAALVRYGETVVLVAAVTGPPRPGIDFFPLQVDYREKTYSAGKFPGGFFKREGRPTEKEIITMRLVDRPVRPLFPEDFKDEVQIHCMVLSFDEINDPDIPSIIGASAALSISGMPFKGPLGAVRMGLVDGGMKVNLTHEDYENSPLNLVVCGRRGNLAMVEGEAREVPEETLLEALDEAQKVIDEIIDLQDEIIEKVARPVADVENDEGDETLVKEIASALGDRLEAALRTEGKFARKDAVKALREEMLQQRIPEDLDKEEKRDREMAFKKAFEKVHHQAHRRAILSGKRIDGRGYQDIRTITSEPGLLPRTHGSALFTRGETQALVALTLGSIENEQRIDGLLEESRKRFLLHYNFPPFSVGETKPIRGPGRREIGHGHLAERAVTPLLPDWEAFPYTIRIVSDILESNGSSSMATVCGASLALMDGGVPLRTHIAGIAMGLVLEEGQVCILSDILGDEDHHGDMDFKVAGTREGVTALQMDIKIDGISKEILGNALEQARKGRFHILDQMEKALPAPRPDLSEYAPAISMVMIDPDKIGLVIGPGGKTIKKIQSDMDVEVDVEDDGRVAISGRDARSVYKAREYVEGLLATPEIGKTYEGVVTSVKDFGAFVEILPGTEGLVHISEMGTGYVERVEDVMKEGDRVTVHVLNIDDAGKVKLTTRSEEERAASRSGGGDRGDRRRSSSRRDRGSGGRGGGRGKRREGGGSGRPRRGS